MPINFVTGLPRTGKTLWTLCFVKDRAEKEKRQVYTCNIPGMNVPGWLELEHPDKWLELPHGSIVIVDELQDFWQKGSANHHVPLPILELSKHGKRGIDFYFITQEPNLVHSTPRDLCEFHYFIVRAFGTHNVMVHKYQRMQLHPEKVKKQGDSFPWRYKKEAFDWYKSADMHNIKRKIPWKIYAMPIALVMAGLMIWAAYSLMGSMLNKAKTSVPALPGSPTQPSRAVEGKLAASSETPAKRVLTAAEYAQSYQPRIPGLAYTAPRYDDLDKPTQRPRPAACIDGTKPGAKTRSCVCWTQQATVLPVPQDLCRQIASNGFFDDTMPPALDRSAVAAANPPPVSVAEARPAGFALSAPLQPPDTKSTVSRDAEVLAFMAKRRYVNSQ